MAGRRRIPKKSSVVLGKNLQRLRISKDVTRKQLGKMVNQNEQKIGKYESGEFISLPVLQEIADALGEQIEKRIIRRISFTRKLEAENNSNLDDELIELYNLAIQIEEDEK